MEEVLPGRALGCLPSIPRIGNPLMKTHKTRPRTALILCGVLTVVANAMGQGTNSPRAGTYTSIPDTIVTESGAQVDVERGLFWVAENRADLGSRTIPVHFLRFPALAAQKNRPPVFLLVGGPGGEYFFKSPHDAGLVERLRRTRDVVYLSHRGNPRAPGLVPALYLSVPPQPLDETEPPSRRRDLERASFQAAVKSWTARGVDLRGYDIINIVDDIHELRAALGYGRIVLRGCSFGSQWAFSYLKRWPQTVDRALLSGVEPLDYAYDSPKWLWASLTRLAGMAESDPAFAKHVPPGGLMAALQGVLQDLEKQPRAVVVEDPATGKSLTVKLGADDLRQLIATRSAFGRTREEFIATWPLFILEMHRGDYRYAAALSWQRNRRSARTEALIVPLIDNSIGITALRDAKLLAEPEARWLGDINAMYRNTRDITPTARVDDAFRADWQIEVPVLLLNGTLDWSTPVENARHAKNFLKQGHLIEVVGGTHCDEGVVMARDLPEDLERINGFIDADFESTPPAKFFATLPDVVSYPAVTFARPSARSLYERWRLEPR